MSCSVSRGKSEEIQHATPPLLPGHVFSLWCTHLPWSHRNSPLTYCAWGRTNHSTLPVAWEATPEPGLVATTDADTHTHPRQTEDGWGWVAAEWGGTKGWCWRCAPTLKFPHICISVWNNLTTHSIFTLYTLQFRAWSHVLHYHNIDLLPIYISWEVKYERLILICITMRFPVLSHYTRNAR